MTIDEKVHSQGIALAKVEERAKSNTKRLDDLESDIKEQSNLVGAIKELAVETKYMREDLNQTIQRIKALENKDQDTWNKFKWLIVALLVTIIGGYIATQIGLK